MKKIIKSLLIIVCITIGNTHAIAQSKPSVSETDAKAQQYNQQALMLVNTNKPDEAKPFIHMALAQKENVASYYLLCHIYAIENEWDSSIKNGEKAIQIDSSFLPVYGDLQYSYTKVGQWDKAQKISAQVQRSDTNGSQAEELKLVDASVENNSRSKILLTLLFLALGSAFLFPLFTAAKTKDHDLSADRTFKFSEIFIVSAAVSCFFWLLFESAVHWIWSFNPLQQTSLFTPPVKMFIYERDGIESFALYLFMLVCMGSTLLFANLLLRLRNKNIYLISFALLFVLSAYYFFNIGFTPPMLDLGEDGDSKFPVIFVLLAMLSFVGYFLYDKFSLVIKIILVLLMAYTSLVMIFPSSLTDLSFVLYPALRLIHGAKISEIYFQYDMLLSFIAYIWMKLNFSIESFAYLGQVSYFLFFIASFFFADRLFKSKWLAVLFITALVIIRYYAILEQGISIFQVTPLRLDLWIIPLIIAYYKGVHHWLVGVALGFLILFHRNLGIIYAGAYVELVLLLFVFDMMPLIATRQFSSANIGKVITRHWKLNFKNALILLASVMLCFILFKEMFSPSALIYRKIGVGMMRISAFSFYWYVPVMVGCLTVLLYRFRNKLGEVYSDAGMFVLLLLVGNSMYFFGRSHENNILNISALLLFSLFILFDILIYLSPKEIAVITTVDKKGKKQEPTNETRKSSLLTRRTAYISLPFLFLFMSGYYYSGRIAAKFSQQSDNFTASQYIYPLSPMPMDTIVVRQITVNSPNVFFLDFDTDFYYYYYGHYAPQGFFNPTESWIYRKDLLDFMQDLLNKHYYIVYNAKKYSSYTDYIPYLNYNHTQQQNDMVALSKEAVSKLLPIDTSAIFHAAFKDTVPKNGMDFANITFKEDFFIELLVKPTGNQLPNATLLSNFDRIGSLTGLTLQANGTIPDQYLFSYSTGQVMPIVYFQLTNDQWNYITIVVNKETAKVYDNGKLVGNIPAGSLPIVNSNTSITIGNNANRDAHFKGEIREIKISNNAIDEVGIMNNWQKLAAELAK